jgi:hypothetical protein
MRNGQAFVGFREAAIDFPPTFKYDVLRTIRHKRKRSKIAQAAAGAVAPLLQEPPEGGDQPEPEGHHDGGHSEVSSDDDTNAELASVISSGTTTFSQRDQESDDDNDSDAESDYLRTRMSYPQRSGGLVKRISISAAQRAKSKLAELINAPSSPRPKRSRRANGPTPQSKSNSKSPRSIPTTPLLGQRATSPLSDDPSDGVLASVSSFKARVHPSPSFVGDGTAETEDDRGVYDSSSKQRVPSWCDRILFKSTVKPDPETEDDSHGSQRTAVSLIAQAWRSFRRTSSTSLRSVSTGTVASSTSAASFNSFPSPHPGDSESDVGRFLPTPYVPRRKRPRPRSVDVATLGTSSQPLTTGRPGTSTGIQMHRVAGAKSGASPNAPARTQTAPSALAVGPNQQYREPSPMEGTPVSSLTSSMTTSSSAASSGSPVSVTAAPGGGSGRNHPRWRLLSFLSRDAEAARAAAEASGSTTTDADAGAESAARMATATATSPSPGSGAGHDGTGAWAAPAESPRHRKGDVVCFSYRTLDDRGMRRLEGRSDHRPVIGAYGIYV